MPTKAERSAWGIKKRSVLEGADLVFLDPDNGIGKETEKHATFSEIRLLRQPARLTRAIAFITFPGRSMKYPDLVRRLHEQLAVETETPAESIITLRTSVVVPTAAGKFVPRSRWFTVVDADQELISRAHAFTEKLHRIPRVKALLDYRRVGTSRR